MSKKTEVTRMIESLQSEIDERQRTIALLVKAQEKARKPRERKPRIVKPAQQSA